MDFEVPSMGRLPNLIHCISTRSDGNMAKSFGTSDEVNYNRTSFLDSIGISQNSCVMLQPEHSNKIVKVDLTDAGSGFSTDKKGPICDGLVTKQKGLFLVFLAADCLPLILVEPNSKVVGLIHAGWKSTSARIAVSAVEKLTNDFNCSAKNLIAVFGPSIHKESYFVFNPLQKQQSEWQPFLNDLPDGSTSVDINGYVRHQLKLSGLVDSNIFESDVDTASDNSFFSHHRDSKNADLSEGRGMCVVGFG